MSNFIIKDGKYSILLGYGYFGEFINDSKMQINPLLLNNEKLEKNIENINNVENKLIKITFDNPYHTDDILEVIYSLQNYEKYISISEKKKYKINKRTMLYAFLSTLKFNNLTHEIILKNYNLHYNFINNEGKTDLQDIFKNIYDNDNITIWEGNTKKKMYQFIKQILLAIEFLHDNKIVHLDIKPENILYNDLNPKLNFSNRFKLIDFGFSDIEPFNNSNKTVKGTVGYIPIYYHVPDELWLPQINPNDWNYNGHISLLHPEDMRYSLYKTDIFSLGRVINYLDYLLEEHFRKIFTKRSCCFGRKQILYNNFDINSLKKYMTEDLIEKRYDVKLCLKYVQSNFN